MHSVNSSATGHKPHDMHREGSRRDRLMDGSVCEHGGGHTDAAIGGDHTGNKVGFAPDLLISLRCFAAAIGGVSAACRLVPARPPFTSCTALDSGVVLTLYRTAAVHCFSPCRTAFTASLCRCSISISSSPSSRALRRARWVLQNMLCGDAAGRRLSVLATHCAAAVAASCSWLGTTLMQR